MSSFAVSVRTVFFECPLRWFLRPAGASLSRWSSSSALRTRSASAFFSSSKSPSLLKTSFGSRPSRSWSRVSFLIAISALRRRHYGPAHKIPDSPFIDETWIKTNMAPLRGWGPRGQRLEARVPHGHWKTLTFIAALRCDRVDAPWVIDGPINGELFTLYVEKVLGPTLATSSSSTTSAATRDRPP